MEDERVTGWLARAAGDDGRYDVELVELARADLPDGDVLVDVTHSAVNYKDALAVTGRGKIFRRLPMVPGIDLAGVVRASKTPRFQPGDGVLATGHGLGESRFGGLATLASVPADAVTPLPAGLDPRRAMGLGTAGLTAMLCVMALERHGVAPGDREVVVTGATGGVGSYAVALLARRGFRVAAATGKLASAEAYLRQLGAARVFDRAELEGPVPGLASERWAGAVDTLGGAPLASLIAQTAYGGAVAACGMAASTKLDGSVFPFILRDVALLGVSSVRPSRERRAEAWAQLGELAPPSLIDLISGPPVPLAAVADASRRLIAGQAQGRVIVDVRA